LGFTSSFRGGVSRSWCFRIAATRTSSNELIVADRALEGDLFGVGE